LFPFARRENDSQVGDRVVTATLRHSINARWFACTYDKVILHIRILHISAQGTNVFHLFTKLH
jgi:hypothetical protein